MGVADSVDLGWKLAAVLQGWGGPALLDSYETERRPVHEAVLEEAVINHATLGNQLASPGLEDDTAEGEERRKLLGIRIQAAKLREFVTLGVVLGYRYDDSPIVIADGSAKPKADFINYVPSSRPGALAPHAWLHDASSLYDHFGQGFTLLARADATPSELSLASEQALAQGIDLRIIQPTEAALELLYPSRFTLIRPDQHVAWRNNDWTKETTAVLQQVVGKKPSAYA